MNNNSTWEKFVLILIDVQEDFWPEATARAFPDFPNNVTKLLNLARKEGIEVLHLRAKFKQDQSDWMLRYKFIERRLPCIEGSPGVEVLPCALEVEGEQVIYKQSFDGFCNPQLQQFLDSKGKRFVLIAGLVTSVCVLLTAASAAQRHYLVALIDDCCADRAPLHDTVLTSYPFIFEHVTVNNLVKQLPTWQQQLSKIQITPTVKTIDRA